MALNVLTDDFRKQLEQEHKRLSKDREAIVKQAIAQATLSIDASLDHISSLLGELASKATKSPGRPKASIAAVSAVSVPEADKPRRGRPKASATIAAIVPADKPKRGRPKQNPDDKAAPTARKTKARVIVDKPTKGKRGKAKGPKVTLELAELKPEFAGMTPTQAIAQVLKKAPQKAYDIDQMIAEIYGPIDGAVAARTRQRVGVMFGHGARRNEFEKVQDNPPLYKLGRG